MLFIFNTIYYYLSDFANGVRFLEEQIAFKGWLNIRGWAAF